MKKCLIAVFLLALLLTACGKPAAPVQTDPLPVQTTAATQPAGTTAPQATEEATAEATTAPESTAAPDSDYLLTVKNHDTLIFAEPSYDGLWVDTVRQAGVYTIVEEVTDSEGNTWGKLKSGAGWVDLKAVAAANQQSLPVSAAELTYDPDPAWLLASEPTQYSTPVVIHAYADLTNARLYSLVWAGENYEAADPMYVAPEMDETTVMLAHLEFLGDMTMFGLSFQDADGNFHHYRISISGRNGAVLLDPYEPA